MDSQLYRMFVQGFYGRVEEDHHEDRIRQLIEVRDGRSTTVAVWG